MDPLSAISLASAVVQFVQFGLMVVNRLDELNTRNPGEVPKSLQAISAQLPLLLNALSRIKSDSELEKLDFDTKCILRGMVTGCSQQVVEVERMINEVARAPGDSFKTKIKKVFVSLKYDEKVWQIERNLHTYISVLILHHVIDSADAPQELAEDTFFDVREKRVLPFVERPALMQELDDNLRDAIWSQSKSPTILLLSGDHGTGKTQLVVEYCHQVRTLGHFKTVFWVDASSLENLSLGFENIYATVKHSVDGSRSEKIKFVAGFLNDLWHPWLLVLDNYDSAELYNNIMELLPTRGSGGIILIGRNGEQNGLGKVLRVPKFISAVVQQQLNNFLVEEVQAKNIEGIKSIVNQGADVDTLIWNEWPCLHRAALFGLKDAVAFLLEHGADINPPIPIRKPVYWAASSGHESVCRLLLDYEDKTGLGAAPVDYQAAFHAAATEGSLEIVQQLLDRRQLSINGKGSYHQTALQAAAQKGHLNIVKFLLERGALREDYTQGRLALNYAASNGHIDVVKILCTDGGVNPNCEDENGNTPLSYAASIKAESSGSPEEGGIELTQFLLLHSADPNFSGHNNEGPINIAATHNHTKKLRLLLDYGADPMRSVHGWRPIEIAVKYNSPEALTMLLDAKSTNTVDRKEGIDAALRYAARIGDRGAVMQLMQAGADINSFSDEGSPKRATPLLLAVATGEIKTAQYLIRQGARQDLADESGRLPLPLAAERGHEALVRDLLRAGGNVDMKSGENEDTMLILAAGKGHEKVVQVLLKNGADQMVGNKFGDIALDVAEEKDFTKVIELLERIKV